MLFPVHTKQTARNATPFVIQGVAGLPSPLGGKLNLVVCLGISWRTLDRGTAARSKLYSYACLALQNPKDQQRFISAQRDVINWELANSSSS